MEDQPAPRHRRRPAWLTAPVITVSVLSVGAGIGQFGVTTVIGDVAATFGTPVAGDHVADQIGLPATTVGVALAIIRLASLGALPISAMGDRHFGRRGVLLTAAAVGLGGTALAALSPGFWWYVALIALARPALSTVNTLAGVVASEEASTRDRSATIALVTAGYGIGSGIVSIGRGLLPGDPSFRVVTGFVVIPLLLLPLLARKVREPRIAREHAPAPALPGAVPRRFVRRVVVLALLTGGIAVATGPGFTYLFIYGEGVLGSSPLFLSMLVLAAGPVGLLGLVVGRFASNRLGRRITAGVGMGMTGLAIAYGYSGTSRDLAIGYLTAITFASAFAPPAGALAAEVVPTRARATAAGWMTVAGVLGAVLGLTLFGVLGDITGEFASAARVLGIGVAVVAFGFVGLPETRDVELEVLDDEDTRDPL